MQLVVSHIPEGGSEQELEMSVTLLDDAIKNDVQVFLRAFKVGDKVLVNGKAETGVSLICSRCLKEFPYPMEVEFETEYVPFREFTVDGKREELDLCFYKDDKIDIEGLVREQLFLALPMKPLCKPDCAGICPKCGKGLNEEICGCNEIDSA